MRNWMDEVRNYAIENKLDIYLIGGALRDRLLQRDISDYDFVSKEDCHRIGKNIADNIKGSYVNMHNDVARIVKDNTYIDIANLKGNNILEDLGQRDFTINSIAENIVTGEIIDIYNGREDLKKQLIRVIKDDVFLKDGIRLLRAVRLASDLDFEIEKSTKEKIQRDATLLTYAAGERILDELYKILRNKESSKYITLLDNLNLLEVVFPIMKRMKNVGKCRYHVVHAYEHSLLTLDFLEKNINDIYSSKWGNRISEHFNMQVNGYPRFLTLKLSAFLHDIGKPDAITIEGDKVSFRLHDKKGEEVFQKIAERLAMSSAQKKIIKSVISGHMRVLGLFKQGATEKAIYNFFRDYGEDAIDIFICSLCDISATRSLLDDKDESKKYWNFIMELIDKYYDNYDTKMSKVKFITGKDVIEVTGLKGKDIGKILKEVDELIFIGNIKTKQEALEFIRKYRR
ncbi:hypothetical protein Q428_00075 [Fervidicella metallireducens AeB]|uniref:Polynucleotide adenylyltransferase n=1 Tax=Fervidicella metallireducens AeB TaxID=1403537 RepID=A0A017RZM2_9CLOT|nr:HD domain-containing protein [Fervidicella metallireducens]EYE89849.1 hypothetical protein Q428_00075 [Fervidicella metallireducens AeB]